MIGDLRLAKLKHIAARGMSQQIPQASDMMELIVEIERLRTGIRTLRDACKLALSAFENRDCIDWNILEQAISAIEGESTDDTR